MSDIKHHMFICVNARIILILSERLPFLRKGGFGDAIYEWMLAVPFHCQGVMHLRSEVVLTLFFIFAKKDGVRSFLH